jgi:caffeic acid 3-O-methyltransferase / acetylserotonin O-methyltransferase
MNEEVPFEKAYGETLFVHLAKHPKFNTIFNDAMSDMTAILMKKILERYTGFNQAQVVVDVGGGIGLNLSLIIAKHQHIKGINFDLPHVISQAPKIMGIRKLTFFLFSLFNKENNDIEPKITL